MLIIIKTYQVFTKKKKKKKKKTCKRKGRSTWKFLITSKPVGESQTLRIVTLELKRDLKSRKFKLPEK